MAGQAINKAQSIINAALTLYIKILLRSIGSLVTARVRVNIGVGA